MLLVLTSLLASKKLRETILTEEGAVFGTVSIRNARNVYQQPKGYEDGIHEKLIPGS